jgi:hypothetical protein
MRSSTRSNNSSHPCDAMRRRYPSDSYASDKARRLRRIKGRACPELTSAFEAGEISLRQFDLRSRLGVRQQKRIIAAEGARSTAALIAAATINRFLDNMGTGTPIQLREVAAAISDAVRS